MTTADPAAASSARRGLFDLTGRRALVTGSSQGIGLALARGLAAAGAQVVLNGRDSVKLGAAAAEIPGARTLPFDVTDRAAVRAAIDDFETTVGPIDILVNNAGIQHRAPLEEFPADAFERLLQSNVASVFHVGQACALHMIVRGAGKIINIASVNASLARYSIAPYTATKGAVANLTKGMATDWARHGLNCNAIAPGYIHTPLNSPLWSDPVFNDWLTKRTPAQRWGQAEELVGACVFLAADASSFVNGHVLYVDGGLTASL
jgi:gluconate 5-dehydrogenase